ncbi:MAG TPA: PIG-L family deacetylase [Acidimicrobiales bacterium]|nr:PIG-L family deacetylase [Acidimicrobiales bacterium]
MSSLAPGPARTPNGLTLMAVHAHPDDEVLGTGGVFARYSEDGVRTVLVTCTNGEQGDGPGGAKPGEPGHDAAEVVATRLAELRKSVSYLGVSDVELLGYRDSGMVGWAANADPGVFSNIPLAEPAERIAALMSQYRPQVVVTYDANGNYGHPDHIQAHRAAVAAAEATGIPAKFYYSAVPKSAFVRLRDALEASGADMGELGIPDDFGTPDEEITTQVDVSAYVERKREALAAHASQTENSFFTRLPDEVVTLALSYEFFTLRSAPHGLARESDLFAGLR